eukprot:SAG31_NODE_725_length_12546_cov_34.366857_5_plen_2399_part_00
MTRKRKALRFDVRQTHLGFCPAEVVLEICVWGFALEFDGHFIEKNPYTDLIMWSACKEKFVFMTTKNMKRVVLKAQNSSKAKTIATEMMKGAERLRRKLEPRLESAFAAAEGDDEFHDDDKQIKTERDIADEKNKARLTRYNSVVAQSSDSENFELPDFKSFQGITQHHLADVPATIILKIDPKGVSLLNRETGRNLQGIPWAEILLWKVDPEPLAITLIMTATNQQIRLETAQAEEILDTMIEFARRLLRNTPGPQEDETETSEEHALHRIDKQSPRDLVIEWRTKMLSYEPPSAEASDAWKIQHSTVTKLKAILSGKSVLDLSASIETREQLRAIFNLVDKNHSGTLNAGELSNLLEDLNMKSSETEIESIISEIRPDNNKLEIGFEEFVNWVSTQESADATATLRQRINHRRKEIQYLQELFDRIDEDCNGTMDIGEFQQLTIDIGLALNTVELQSIWREVDTDSSGEVEFDEFVAWFKGQSKGIAAEMRRCMRMTKMLLCAKGAMIYAVDQGNRQGKKTLLEMFDYLDKDGSGELGRDEIEMLAEDLKVSANSAEIDSAVQHMDTDGNGEIGFEEFRRWWCSTGAAGGGLLRAKLKLAGFTAKSSGSVLNVTQTTDEGALEAEKQLDELLQSAFTKPEEMTGNALGFLGPKNPIRLLCYKIIFNPVSDRMLLMIIFGNVFLMAVQSPSSDQSWLIDFANFFIVVIFTVEMIMRIVSHGLLKGDKAYLQNGWNVFDGTIIGSVWTLYAISLLTPVNEKASYLVTLLRAFRALRFFTNLRQILLAIVQGRAMLMAVTMFVLFMFILYYVILHQLYSGAFTLVCAKESQCVDCGLQISHCPAPFGCGSPLEEVNNTAECLFLTASRTSNKQDRLHYIDIFGFDTIGQSFLTTFEVTTLDEWSFLTNSLRKSDLSTSSLAWPTIASLVITVSLFTVNIFVSSMAFSYIKVRKTARNLDAKNDLEKKAVDLAISDGLTERVKYSRHILQAWHPTWTRQSRWLLRQQGFEYTIIIVVLVNIACMMLVQHPMSTELTFALDIAEIVFTCLYTMEMMIKIQAMGPKTYFQGKMNCIDAAIVTSALAGYAFLIFGVQVDTTKGAVLRVGRLFRLVRVARVAKLVFRSENIRDMTAKAFGGLDAIGSLMIFSLFFLTVCSIAAMNLFSGCNDGTSAQHTASFRDFWQSFLTTFQVYTTDSWGLIMAETVRCAGTGSAAYFVCVIFLGNFVLGNMFIAIFIENLEISDEEKRDKQIHAYIQELNTAGNDVGGVRAMTDAMGSIKNTLDRSDASSALKHYTFDALVKGARLTPKLAARVLRQGSSGGIGTYQSVRDSNINMDVYSELADATLGIFYPNNPIRMRLQKLAVSMAFHHAMTLFVALSGVSTALTVDLKRGKINSPSLQLAVFAVQNALFVMFLIEFLSKIIADGLLSTRKAYLNLATNRFEFFLVMLQLWAILYPDFEVFLCLRTCRLLYMIKRIKVMVEAFTSSMAAVWTVLVLMVVTFVVYGIAGVFLFAGKLWHCENNSMSDRTSCELAGLRWINRPFHFDNIVEAWGSLFIIWSMQGWTSIWFWLIDAPAEVDSAPTRDNSSLSASIFCISFILWNSFLLTKLFTAMLADFFAQSSGSILMTSEQRNWQFMSMFIYSALKEDTRIPPTTLLRAAAYKLITARWFTNLINFVIIANVLSMIGESATLALDPTGFFVNLTHRVNEFTLSIYIAEGLLRIVALGPRLFWNERKLDIFVLTVMAAAASYHLYAHHLRLLKEFHVRVDWILALQFVRALRLGQVFGEVYAIRKIYFILGMSVDEVTNLLAFMGVVFFLSGVWFQNLCGDIPRGSAITDTNNFDSVSSSIMLLFEICTGTSLVGVIDECRLYSGPLVPVYFYLFFLISNLVLLNLFVALLLDNFDLMGSDDFAVSDVDIQLFKQQWKASGYGLHEQMNISQLQNFLVDNAKGMGTFGMMPEADPYFFNRILFELDLTREDELKGQKEVSFFPVLLALCHMRFSSSCLSLGEEVAKSNMLMQRVENHAARLIQIGWKYYSAKLSVPEEYKTDEERPKWNSALKSIFLLQLSATVKIDRITPEHVVAGNLDRLQVLVDRKESKKFQRLLSQAAKSSDDGWSSSQDNLNRSVGSFDDEQGDRGRMNSSRKHGRSRKLKELKQFTTNPMMSKSVIGVSNDSEKAEHGGTAGVVVGIRNLNPMMLGSFDSEDFYDNELISERVSKVSLKKIRSKKKSRKSSNKNNPDSIKKVNPMQAMGVSVDQTAQTPEKPAAESKKGRRRGSLTKLFESHVAVEAAAEPNEAFDSKMRIDNPILRIMSSDDMHRVSGDDASDDIAMSNPINVLNDTLIQKQNPLMVSQQAFDQRSLSAALRNTPKPNDAASSEDVMKTLAWKERNAFMTRKAK